MLGPAAQGERLGLKATELVAQGHAWVILGVRARLPYNLRQLKGLVQHLVKPGQDADYSAADAATSAPPLHSTYQQASGSVEEQQITDLFLKETVLGWGGGGILRHI